MEELDRYVNWRTGPPPAPGWYNASVSKDLMVWRWWPVEEDGELYWSCSLYPDSKLEDVALRASMPFKSPLTVKWSDFKPEDAIRNLYINVT